MNNYKEKIKNLYEKYKEAKKDPRKRAGMKLLGYFIFFFILLLLANITNYSNKTTINNQNTTTTTKNVDKYVEKQNKLLINKYNISYKIKYNDISYNINGVLENNIITGYLEYDNNIKKITIKNNEIYEIENNIESLYNNEFNINYINIEYILNTIKQNKAFIQEKEDFKTYLYEIENENILTKIYIKCNEENIQEITINELNNEYTLIFDN